MPPLSQTAKTIILCTISAIVCGLLFAPIVANFQKYTDSMSIIEDWRFWLQGAIFGLMFSMVNVRGILRIAYAFSSRAIYVVTAVIFLQTGGLGGDYGLFNNSFRGGMLAGAFGAVALAVLTKVLSRTAMRFRDELITSISGAMTGVPFYIIIFYGLLYLWNYFNSDNSVVGSYFASAIPAFLAFWFWQIPVAWRLTTTLQKQSNGE